jgi:hypothetical protein
MTDAPLVQEHDVIARPNADGSWTIYQYRHGREHRLEGPVPGTAIEARTLELAEQHGGDAWIADTPGTLRVLN